MAAVSGRAARSAAQRWNRCRLGAGLALCLWGCVDEQPAPPANALVAAALLPFTGDFAATGASIERTLIMVIEEIEQAGGISGVPLLLAAEDSHADLFRGTRSLERLLAQNPVVLLGPENEDLASSMVQRVSEDGLPAVSGGLLSSRFSTDADGGYWFRTNPTARDYAAALASRMAADGIRSATLVHGTDERGKSLANAVQLELVMRGIVNGAPVAVEPGRPRYSDKLTPVVAGRFDAVVLALSPLTGARIVQEWDILGGTSRLYLAPTLKDQAFPRNATPGPLRDAVGVSAALADEPVHAFAQRFAARWNGERPLPVSYFYHDAAAIAVLAVAAASAGGAVPERAAVRDRLLEVATAPGEVVTWDHLAEGVALASAGVAIDYRGVTGELELLSSGDVSNPGTAFWRIDGIDIVDEPP